MTAGAFAFAEPEEPELPEIELSDVPEDKAPKVVDRPNEERILREEAPADMPPPAVVPEPRTEQDDAEIDSRALKALSRQERREAKSAIRREKAEARNAARQAKALAKAAAKAGLPAPAVTPEVEVPEVEVSEVAAAEFVDAGTAEIPAVVDDEPALTETPTDPRARAAARVQRRLGKDAEKLSAAEARAQAKEEARSRRAQAKELRSGVVAVEEPVVREPEEIDDSIDQAVQSMDEQAVIDEPIFDEPVTEQTAIIEPVVQEAIEEPVFEEPVFEEPVVEEPVIEEPVMARPAIAERIDEPAPVVEPPRVEVKPKPDPVTPTTLPMDSEEPPKASSPLGPIAGILGLIALGISVLLAVGALLVALGFDSGGLYNGLQAVANTLVGPLKDAFDFDGASAERKEHFLAWGAGSIGYLVLSFVGQAVQRANADDE